MSSFPFYSYGLNTCPNAPSIQEMACGSPMIVDSVGRDRWKKTFGTYTLDYPYRNLSPAEMDRFPKWPQTQSVGAFTNCPMASAMAYPSMRF